MKQTANINRTIPQPLHKTTGTGTRRTIELKTYKPVNQTGELLTTEKLRQFKGFENCTDEEADAITTSLTQLSRILVKACNKEVAVSEKSKAIRPDQTIDTTINTRRKAA